MYKENEFKDLVVENLIYYRKINNLTQLELAEKLNYSDKTISKWERGEGLPSIYVLHKIANLFGVTLNDFTNKRKVKIKHKKTRSRALITLIAFVLCWLVATIVYVILELSLPDFNKSWLAFIYAIPVSMIVLIVFTRIWRQFIYTFTSSSILIWSIPLAIYLSIDYDKLWLLFISAIPLQILIIFFFTLRKDLKNQKTISEEMN